MKKWNEKTKGEQLFILCMLFMMAFGLVCLTGCGGCSCETPKCGCESEDGVAFRAVSIPGCGGCITPEKGCDTILWPQSCRFVSYTNNGEMSGSEEGCFVGCDIRYYGDGCFGCGQKEQSCYNGCINIEGENGVQGCGYGTTDDNDEKVIGCVGDRWGCGDGGGSIARIIANLEGVLGAD